ncbi:BRO-N domain-containing protein [Spirosoma panaciterrae]|uniref:BRO-N domain-containing protein n=1 Tax=Spirosoma panaciterrae TaxID=496058 RepID=UPI00035ED1AF|nr:Bro-N domain-containing protein [Spirosoma panaciterrae]
MTKQDELRLFRYSEKYSLRETDIEGEPWFIAIDVCEILDISNVSDAVQKLDDDEKLLSSLPISGQTRKTWIINESGLYHLALKSEKPEAQNFRRWITKVVLPQIRREGRYTSEQERIKAERIKELRAELKTLRFSFSQMRHLISQKDAELDKLIDTEPSQMEIFNSLKHDN